MNRTLLYATTLLLGVQPAVAQTQTSNASPVIRIASGSIRGVAEGDISSFKGIPFAAPSTGAFRWRPPQPMQPWRDVREIAFVFGTLGTPIFGPPPPPPSAEDKEVSRMAQSYWINFAKTGNPNGQGLPMWPRYEAGKDQIFDFPPDGSAKAIPNPWKLRLDMTQLATEAGKRADF